MSSDAGRQTVDGAGTPRESVAQPEVGARIGRYVVVDRLGQGAMGVVYAAWDPELDRRVALKLLGADVRRGSEGRMRLVREAQALARLSHPNVVGVHDVGTMDDRVWIAMEFVQGQTLDAWLRGRRRSWPAIVDMLCEAGRGLAAAHAAGLVHRDFKPENVMVGDDGRVRVMDFGLARPQSSSRSPDPESTTSTSEPVPIAFTRTGALVGTPAYMAPEAHARTPTDARSDQFSFCVSLWEALYGERPFAGGTVVELAANVLSGKQRTPPTSARVPAWLRRAIARGLAVDPTRRWSKVDDLLAALARGRARASLRRSLVAVGVLGVLGVAAFAVRQVRIQRRIAACEREAAVLTERWDEPTRAAVPAVFAAAGLPDAELTAARIVAVVDRDVAAWAAARAETCVASEVDGTLAAEPYERATWCLDEQRIEIEAFVDGLAVADRDSLRDTVIDAQRERPIARCADRDAQLATPPPPETRADVREILVELTRATVWLSPAHYATALAAARGQLARAELVGWPPLVAESRLRVGILLEHMGSYDESEQMLQEAWFEAMRSGAHEVAASAGTTLTYVVGFALARHREGLLWAREAELAIAALGSAGELRRAQLLSHRAAVQYALGDYAASHASVTAALAIRERELAPEDTLVAESLGDLSNVEQRLGRPERSRELLRRALELEERALGPNHPLVAVTLVNLANIQRELGELDEAEALFERGIAVQRRTIGPHHPDVATSLNNLAALFIVRDDNVRARALLEESLAIKRGAFGEQHPDVAVALANLAGPIEQLGDRGEARRLLERSLEIHHATLGPQHFEIAVTVHELALLALRDDRPDDAVTLLERELDILAREQVDEIAGARLLLADTLWRRSESRPRAIELARAARDQLRDAGKDAAAAEAWLGAHPLR